MSIPFSRAGLALSLGSVLCVACSSGSNPGTGGAGGGDPTTTSSSTTGSGGSTTTSSSSSSSSSSTTSSSGSGGSGGSGAVCGNGTVETGEDCDDGNQVNDDACSNICKLPGCGDGIVQLGEECDL